ncbi:MAG: serpin family protein [Mediterranea sp.]|jgi:serpin B|nr:serpin family protein [Mediterranea sp.]
MKNCIYPIIFLCLAACDQGAEDNNSNRKATPYAPLELSTVQQSMADANTTSSLNLFKEVAAEKPTENLFLSPISASYALNMTANGAAGNTLTEMRNVLGLDGYKQNGVNDFYRKLTTYLQEADGETILGLANSIWVRTGYPVQSDFINVNKDNYAAEVRTADFNSTTLKAINQWVNDKTYGHIPNMLDKISENDVMYLINALYFDGVWKVPFTTTPNKDFTNQDGSQSKVNMLTGDKRSDPYYADDDLQMVQLNYGNGTYSMVLLLPNDDPTLQKTTALLTAENWKKWTMGANYSVKVNVKFPKLDLSYEQTLDEPLKMLGMKDAFAPNQANFANLATSNNFCISKVLQKTTLKVDEKGTTATASTVVIGMDTSAGPDFSETVDFIVDKPFLYAIKENSTQTILFIGSVKKL